MTKKMLAAGYDFGGSSANLTADLSPANSTVTPANITGLGLAVGIGQFDFDWVFIWSCSTTAGLALQLNGPSVSSVSYYTQVQSNTTTIRTENKQALATLIATSASAAVTTLWWAKLSGRVVTTAAGTLQPQFASTVAAAPVTIKAGSFGSVTPRL